MPPAVNDITIGPYEEGDEHEILAVFERVFDVKRSLAAWRWGYAENPAGLHVFLGRLPEGQVVSQFAGIPRRIGVRDGEATFAEIVDSLTDPAHRKGLKKPGLFASTCYRFVDHYGRPDREAVMYGLPNPPAFRVGRALLGYVHLYDIEFLVRGLAGCPETWTPELPGGGIVETVPGFPGDVDAFFERFRSRHAVLTIRDARYLNWRYVHPEIEYERLLFRDPGGAMFGLAVLRHGWLDEPQSALVELLLEEGHPQAPSALEHVAARARASGSEQLKVLFAPHCAEHAALQDAGWVPTPSQFRFVARTYDPERLPLDWLRDNWFISLGDFDIA